VGARRDGGRTLADERRGVGHAANHRRAVAEPRLDRPGPDTGRDREHPGDTRGGKARKHGGNDVGLHRDDRIGLGGRHDADRQPGNGRGQYDSTSLGGFDDMEFVGLGPPVVDHPAEERLGHLAAADHLELGHGSTPYAAGRPATCETRWRQDQRTSPSASHPHRVTDEIT